MKKKYDFLIMYEVTTREMESIILLGNELKSRGYTVDYFSFEHCNLKKYLQNKKIIKKYHNNVEVVLMPSLYHDKEVYYLVNYVCGNCKNIVNLRWEQTFNYQNEKNYDSYHYPHGDAQKAYHLCWGENSYNCMQEAGVDKSKLLLCGPVHLDFLRPQFKDYYYSREELFERYDIPTDKKCVLFISSFAIATRTERQVKLEEESAGQALFGDAVQKEQITRNAYLEWIEALLQKNTCTFIYRPHPVENVLGDLGELCKKYKNFRVISDFSVKQWILRCDALVTWVSTSIAEAFYAQKTCLIARPFKIAENEDMCLYKDSKILYTKEEFVEAADKASELTVSPAIMKEYYDYGETPSYIRLCNELEKIIADKDDKFPWDEEKIKEFKSHKLKFIVQSMLVAVYVPIINLMGKIKEKTKISYGPLNSRVDSFRKALTVKHIKLADEKTINDISEKIKKFM